MKYYHLTLGVLAVWRITHFFQAEDGPWDVVVRLRRAVGNGFWGLLLDCFQCLSVWVAAPLAWWLGESWGERFLLWLSFSAGAILLEKITTRNSEVPRALFVEGPEEESADGLLRTEAKPVEDRSETRPAEDDSGRTSSS